MLVDMHHIISDGVSVNILIREFGELYNNRKLPALRIQYKDYAVWQEEFKTGDAYKTQEAYWLKQLEGELPVLDLPADHARRCEVSLVTRSHLRWIKRLHQAFTSWHEKTEAHCTWCSLRLTPRSCHA